MDCNVVICVCNGGERIIHICKVMCSFANRHGKTLAGRVVCPTCRRERTACCHCKAGWYAIAFKVVAAVFKCNCLADFRCPHSIFILGTVRDKCAVCGCLVNRYNIRTYQIAVVGECVPGSCLPACRVAVVWSGVDDIAVPVTISKEAEEIQFFVETDFHFIFVDVSVAGRIKVDACGNHLFQSHLS